MFIKEEREPGHQRVQTQRILGKIKKVQKMKSIISSNYKFVPLTKVFGVIDMKSKTGIGSNDWGSSNQDKRKPGEV